MNNTELDKLEEMLSDFNIFETLGLVNADIRHSNVLSWLLNPNANHGLNIYFLKLFLKQFVSENKTDFIDICRNYNVGVTADCCLLLHLISAR